MTIRRRRGTTAAVAVAMAAATIAMTASALGAPAAARDDEPELLTAGLTGVEVAQAPLVAGSVCLPDTTPASLDTLFDTEPGGVIGADYARTHPLPDGSVLWTFQDAEIRLPTGSSRIVHNIGVVQTGACFDILRSGTASDPTPWLFAADTAPLFRWFWPLDAAMGSDGRLYIFAAEMTERGEEYLSHTEPLSVAVAALNPATRVVEWYGSATNSSADLYGWAIESDPTYTYLYAQCHRQFGWDPIIFGVLGHDRSCSDRVTVGRVPVGRLFDPPQYWTGSGWSPDASRAAPVIDQVGRLANPSQITWRNNRWVAVTKVDDWWGHDIVVEQASRPTGPFVEIARFAEQRKCPVECNTYFASWIDGQTDEGPDAPMMISLSHNRWDGVATSVYRPTFFTIEPPPDAPAAAARCALAHCD